MKIICAWCQEQLGWVLGEPHDDGRITHDICGHCANLELALAGWSVVAEAQTEVDGMQRGG